MNIQEFVINFANQFDDTELEVFNPETLCFRRYWQQTGRDDFHMQEVEQQLCDAIRRGHDVL